MSSSAPALTARFGALLLTLLLFATPAGAQESSDKSHSAKAIGEVVFDVVVLRPVGAVQTVLGAVLFLAVGPLSFPGGGSVQAFEVLVRVPFDETFTRELGDF